MHQENLILFDCMKKILKQFTKLQLKEEFTEQQIETANFFIMFFSKYYDYKNTNKDLKYMRQDLKGFGRVD